MLERSGAPSGAPGGNGGLPDPLSAVHQLGLRAVLVALNHLLDQDEAARARLAPHAGRVLRIEAQPSAVEPSALALRGPPPLDLRVTEAGRLQAASRDDSEPAVRMRVRLSVESIFDFFREGAVGMQRHLRIEGDVLFAAALGELARSLRWEVEEDLSRLTGDALAHRLMGAASQQHLAMRDLMERAAYGLARYFTVEAPTLVTRGELREHADALSSLESRLSSLERRSRQRS